MLATINSCASFFHELKRHASETEVIITKITQNFYEPVESPEKEGASLPWIHWNHWQAPVFGIFCELSRTFLNSLSVNPTNVAMGLAGTTGLAGAVISVWFHAALSPISWVALLLTSSLAIPAALVAIAVTLQRTSMLLDDHMRNLYAHKVVTLTRSAAKANLPAELPLNKLRWLYRLHQSAVIGTHFLRLGSNDRKIVTDLNRSIFNLDSEYLDLKINHLAKHVKAGSKACMVPPKHHRALTDLLDPKVTPKTFEDKVSKLS